ncbi:uncharacterized protein LOC125492925 [Beta vulgaris subsp. vulgaris]|uniref:uncharacterized protein LOC125492925 n=1 Tax=Beta vulgaris subsp. vulgaris TaxID=3555 RepID=UPI002037346D|nr:uncharacterized protein LOC125492925 [Beta vulgaris subsp. vulgaris]
MHLIELEFAGATHTWARGHTPDTRQSARLDRALCNGVWSLRFQSARVRHLPAVASDHCPLLISPNGFTPLHENNLPFRFQVAWLLHEHFQEFIQGIQKVLALNPHRGLIKLESKLRHELDDILAQEEMHWYQKARLDWIEYGDKNTTFFHLSTVLKQWKNKIVAIRGPEGELLRDKELVKERIVDYFALLFTEDGVDEEFDIPTGIFPELPPREWNALNLPFTKPEIDEVVQNMGSLKAPGSDGFQPLFYQKNWELVKNNVYDLAFHVLEVVLLLFNVTKLEVQG